MHLMRIDDDQVVNLDQITAARWESIEPPPADGPPRRQLVIHLAGPTPGRVVLPDAEPAYLAWRMLARLALDPWTETCRRMWPYRGREGVGPQIGDDDGPDAAGLDPDDDGPDDADRFGSDPGSLPR